jgi:hypothetical protein
LHLDGSPHVIRTTITLWHFDAGSGRRPPHQLRPPALQKKIVGLAPNPAANPSFRNTAIRVDFFESCQWDVPKSQIEVAARVPSAGEIPKFDLI